MAECALPAWADDDLFPFTSRFVDIDEHTVHYVDEGSGPTLLLLHGNPTWSFLWRDVIRALRDNFRCVAPDYPGFGLSTAKPGYRYLPEEHADVVTGFVDALGLSEVTLVGQDWGGPIGLAAAQRARASSSGWFSSTPGPARSTATRTSRRSAASPSALRSASWPGSSTLSSRRSSRWATENGN
ncbi:MULTISPECIES: alpha/beta fold hydrolase [Amycolatopsis]|uniref:alpha/beta fold hydrolase n=1 Tax=Amycolatopsis TaxID=1813 RepID=UPI0007E27928|nr:MULTISPECIES: alpha/beta fold hydrolase [Amycolatopsis]OAP26785.1 Haloalkane dehalogenase [Amycolatopsis sp. M39]